MRAGKYPYPWLLLFPATYDSGTLCILLLAISVLVIAPTLGREEVWIMAVLRHIGPVSAFKIGFVSYALLGLMVGVFCSLITLTGTSFAPYAHVPFARTIGLMAVILCPVVYGVIGGIGAVISAFIYNLASGWVGRIEVEIG